MFETFYEFTSWLASVLESPLTKLVSYVVGPILALVSFAYGMRERARLQRMMLRLVKNARRLGRMKEQASQERQRVIEMQRQLDQTKQDVLSKEEAVRKLRSELEGITRGSGQLWKLRPNRPFSEYGRWILESGARIVTFANLKGGVGKTTLAANFAAYVSETLGKRVLVLDLDYQGSLSNMMMLAAEQEIERSDVDDLLKEDANPNSLTNVEKELEPSLHRAFLVPASFSLAEVENQLLLQWLLNEDSKIDVRYRLAHVLLDPAVRCRFGAIVIDTPPRMSIGTVNALVASHYFVVPSTLDPLGTRAVGQFLTNMRSIKTELTLNLDLTRIVGTMSRQGKLNPREEKSLEALREAGRIWRKDEDLVSPVVIPHKAAISNAAGESVAYLGQPVREIFDPLFEDIAKRIMLTNH